MSYYFDVCDKTIRLKSKNKHFLSNIHKEFDKCKHTKLTKENPNINNIDELFHAYISERNKKINYYRMKCEFILVFNNIQYCPYVTSELKNNRTMYCWNNLLENMIIDFKNKAYKFNKIAK